MITNDGKLIYRLDEVIDAGLNTHIEDLPDLLVKFTGNITNPVVAYDVESGEEKVTKYTQESVPIDSLDNINLRTYPSRELCHLVERRTLNTINVHTFHRPYPWPDDEPLRTVKLDTSRLDRDPLEGFFSAEYGSHGIEILAAKKSVQEGSNTLEFVKVTGDNNVPRGLVSIRANLDQEIRDSELLEDSDIRVSSDDNLPWPLTCPTRPIGKSYSAQGKIANSVGINIHFSTKLKGKHTGTSFSKVYPSNSPHRESRRGIRKLDRTEKYNSDKKNILICFVFRFLNYKISSFYRSIMASTEGLSEAQLRAQKRQERLLAKSSDRLARLTGGSNDRVVSDLPQKATKSTETNTPPKVVASDDPDDVDLAKVEQIANQENDEVANEAAFQTLLQKRSDDIPTVPSLEELLAQQPTTPSRVEDSNKNARLLAIIRVFRVISVISLTVFAVMHSSLLPWHESFSVLASADPEKRLQEGSAAGIEFFPLWSTLLPLQIFFYVLTSHLSPPSNRLPKLPGWMTALLDSPLVPEYIVNIFRWLKIASHFLDDLALSVFVLITAQVVAEYVI
ncbi:hypothetical protein E3Q23_02559 [Wallemia mellicola]|uniref:Uncharacterized protein n=1 Tax=Wallemia mellicola TaxID=1708541 RepID=A0A4T0PIQ5_9BASI|nr:hypothetical protein E3Q23_02559 [Wallemia mellicola]TIC10650.1 hypothetical protein E3Q14_02691 [Wallemia mellicola]TIC64413.1 hypothetical protein E3Q01_02765 [Wallemia mellicola]